MAPPMSTILSAIFARDEKKTTYNPFPWTIARNDLSRDGCPSRVRILVTFAVINVIVGIISVILGNRRVVRFLTRGIMGKESDSKHYHFLWVINVGLNLAASATNAFIMKNTQGYGERFSVAHVMLFYTTRPRITWIFSGLLTTPFAKQRAKGKHWSDDWVSFAYSQAFAEIALQIICIYTLITANTYREKQEEDGIAGPGTTSIFKSSVGMIEVNVGALGWVVVFGVSFLLGFAVLSYAWFGAGGGKDSSERSSLRRTRDLCFLAVVVTLGCNWLFWDGYLREFPLEYCPPKLTLQGAVWALFTAVGIPFGVGF